MKNCLQIIYFIFVFFIGFIAHAQQESLIEACYSGDLETVKSLIQQGVNPNFQRNNIEPTPLMIACINKHKNIVEYLLKNKANPNAWCYQGSGVPTIDTALTFSINYSDLEIIKLLLENGAQVNPIELHLKHPAATYVSPIIYAWNKNYETIRLIILFANKNDFNKDEKDLLRSIILKQAKDKNDNEIVTKIDLIIN